MPPPDTQPGPGWLPPGWSPPTPIPPVKEDLFRFNGDGGGGDDTSKYTRFRTITIPGTNRQIDQGWNPLLNAWEALSTPYNAPQGGGGSGPDHFFDTSPYQQWNQNRTDTQDAIDNARNSALDKQRLAESEAQQAIAQGNLALARQKQEDANYWAAVAAAQSGEQNALTGRGQDINRQNVLDQIASARYNSDQNFQVGMAGAKNDQERNRIQAAWNQEQAAIAKMEDETRRVLGTQANQTGQFSAETGRAVGMGNLALDTDKFIQQMATSPRDLFGLFMQQRGIAPDWAHLAAGGSPNMGTPLVPQNPQTAYVPTTAAPVFNGQPVGNVSFGNVGNATAGAAGAGGNQFIGPSTAVRPAPGAAPAPWAPTPTPAFTPAASRAPATPSAGPSYTPYTQGAVPEGEQWFWGPEGDLWAFGAAGTPARVARQGGNASFEQVPRNAAGGMMNDRFSMIGDSQAPNPEAGGAQPEGLYNPTGAPLSVIPNWMMRMMGYGGVRHALGTADIMRTDGQPVQKKWNGQAWVNNPAGASPWDIATPPVSVGLPSSPWSEIKPSPSPAFIPGGYPGATGPGMPGSGANIWNGGAAVSAAQQAYLNNGMGNAWINSSQNPYIRGNPTPPPDMIRMLMSYGMPIPPSLYDATTGQISPPSNIAAPFMSRGGGVMPSLQTVGRMSDSEVMALQGYAEGVVGIPWKDIIGQLGRGTENLQGARRAIAA